MKIRLGVLIAIILSVFLVDCQKNVTADDAIRDGLLERNETNSLKENNEENHLEVKKIVKVEISKPKGSEEISSQYFRMFEDEDSLVVFQEMLKTAVKQPGIVDIVNPDFKLNLHFEDGSHAGYYLWVGQEGEQGTLMKVEDTHHIYYFSADVTAKIRDLASK